jgi:asparagine synthetase A
LKNHEEQVKPVEEWVKKAFGKQLERLPDQLQYLKSEWEQTHYPELVIISQVRVIEI